MNILLIGIQGSGKGTQAKLLKDRFGWQHITTGDLFRQNLEQGTEIGLKAKAYMDRGELVPDEFVYQIVKNALTDASEGFILDGFPRNLEQFNFLQENFQIDKAVLLELSDQKAIERITSRRNCENCKKDYNLLFKKPKVDGICDDCGGKIVQREDDNEAAINKRIEKYHNETEAVIDESQKIGKLVIVDADQPVQKIHEDIVEKLNL
jgi:adenylate kinase